MNILTCNIRCYGADDGDNGWEYRKDFCGEVITSRAPDVICFQEVWAEQFDDLTAMFPEFRSYAMVDEPAGRNPMNSIFYRAGSCRPISAGGYWLSQTPHVAGSSSWNSRCVRLANWVRLEETATGAEFRVVNTHLDHISQRAREHQAELIVEDTEAYPADYPQVLTGDMNCDFGNRAIDVFKKGGWVDTYAAVHGTDNPGSTFHGFHGPQCRSEVGKMDWIFMRGEMAANDAEVITDSRNGRFPSDHYFVGACIEVTP